MIRKTRRALGFESLEGKLLLSHGHAEPTVRAQVADLSVFSLTGILSGLPLPNNNAVPGEVTAFSVSGSLGNMGKVKGTFDLSIPFYYGGSPNLSGATLSLSNKRGSVDLFIAPSKSSTYDYVVDGATRYYAGVTGSGLMKVHFSQKLFGLVQIVLHTLPH